jgi:predicted nucleic acid-binding protein
MLVISDASPLRYLCEIGVVEALPKIYGRVMTTPQVLNELMQQHFPLSVRNWVANPPAWLEIQQPREIRFALGPGESSALSLALEQAADLVLIDEREATRVAKAAGLKSNGTLGVLLEGALAGKIDFENALQTLISRTRFRHTTDLIAAVRQQYQDLRHDLEHRGKP